MTEAETLEFPEWLKNREIWVCWAFDDAGRKRPRAPWHGHSYPCKWGKHCDDRPETDFELASQYANLREWELELLAPLPPDAADENLKIGVILPHEPPDPPLMLVDLDDVRDPETGEITEPAMDLIGELNAYASVSVSGRGVHCLVRAELPPRMGKFIELFDPDDPEIGQIELYDHARFAALTGQHLDRTPLDIPHRQEAINRIIEEYSTDDDPFAEPEFDPGDYEPADLGSGDRSSTSPYFTEPILGFSGPVYGERTSRGARGTHPVHGATDPGHADADSRNFNVDSSKNVWHCFAHDSGGGPLALVAVLENIIDCGECGDSRVSALDQLDDEEFLDVCLAARDKYGFSGEPPYRALVGIGRKLDLSMANEDEGILGRATFEMAHRIYDSMSY